MAQSTSKDLEQALYDDGHTKDSDNSYSTVKDNGTVVRSDTDGDYIRTSENGWSWQKHTNGDRY